MRILKVAALYFFGFFVSLLLLGQAENWFSFIESPYKNFEDIVYGALYFTLFFTLFDQYVLKKLLK